MSYPARAEGLVNINTQECCKKIRDVALKTCRKQWTIENGGKKGSGISVMMAWHDDDDYIRNPSAWAGSDSSSILKWKLTVLNSQFFLRLDRYYLTSSWENKQPNTFLEVINPKVDAVALPEFELAVYNFKAKSFLPWRFLPHHKVSTIVSVSSRVCVCACVCERFSHITKYLQL